MNLSLYDEAIVRKYFTASESEKLQMFLEGLWESDADFKVLIARRMFYKHENIGIKLKETNVKVSLDDIKAKEFYLLNEKDKKTRKEGKKTYIYKLQNVKGILDIWQ